jgi:5-hydroxyisourate hydrolase-like protein (transthyretin family)
MFYDDIYKIVNPQPEVTITRQEDYPTDTIKEIVFELDGNIEDSTYLTNFLKLNKYRFKFDNKKWSYKNTEQKDTYVNFYKENIDEIMKKDSLNNKDFKKDEFINKLEEISGGKEIENKAVPVNQTEQNSLKTTIKQKLPEKKNPQKTVNDIKSNKVKDPEKVGEGKV